MIKNISEISYVANNKETPPEVLDKLSNINDLAIKYLIAKNPNTSAETLTKLAKVNNFKIQVEVAKNPNVSSEALETLFKSDKNLWSYIARNENTLQKTLSFLAQNGCLSTKIGVMFNENAPKKALEYLAKDEHLLIRVALSKKPDLPIEVLKILSEDNSMRVRQNVASNLNTPFYLLKKLSQDYKAVVRWEVMANENIYDAGMTKFNKEFIGDFENSLSVEFEDIDCMEKYNNESTALEYDTEINREVEEFLER